MAAEQEKDKLPTDQLVAGVERVSHPYNDFSNEPETGNDAEAQCIQADEATLLQRNAQSFPSKLHYMLAEVESDGLENIVSWQPHGRCFVVRDQRKFVEKVLPLWFRQSKFPSFQRQLNLYGFKRLTTGRDKGGYYHELFLRGKRFLAHRIQRIKIKGQGARKPSAPDLEPNFYALGFLPPAKRSAGSHGGRVVQASDVMGQQGVVMPNGGSMPTIPGMALPSLAGMAFQRQQAAMALLQNGPNHQLELLNGYQTQLWPPSQLMPAQQGMYMQLLQQQQQQQGGIPPVHQHQQLRPGMPMGGASLQANPPNAAPAAALAQLDPNGQQAQALAFFGGGAGRL